MKFTTPTFWLLFSLCAILALSLVLPSQTTYFLSCILVPTILAIGVRYLKNWKHAKASLLAIGAATVIGSAMLAYASFKLTFIEGASGFLVGDGWNSVAASAIVGGIVGGFCGIISLLLYFSIVVTQNEIGTPQPKQIGKESPGDNRMN